MSATDRRCQCHAACPRVITSRDPKAKYHPYCRVLAAKVKAALREAA